MPTIPSRRPEPKPAASALRSRTPSSPPFRVKNLFVVGTLTVIALLAAPMARAQAAPNFPTDPAAAPRAPRANAQEAARQQRRAAMSPDEARRDEQMALLEARTGNTSFSRGGPERQLDKTTGGGGFTVRKFKSRPGQMAGDQRGQGHYRGGIDPPGKPLEHKHKTKRFLLF